MKKIIILILAASACGVFTTLFADDVGKKTISSLVESKLISKFQKANDKITMLKNNFTGMRYAHRIKDDYASKLSKILENDLDTMVEVEKILDEVIKEAGYDDFKLLVNLNIIKNEIGFIKNCALKLQNKINTNKDLMDTQVRASYAVWGSKTQDEIIPKCKIVFRILQAKLIKKIKAEDIAPY